MKSNDEKRERPLNWSLESPSPQTKWPALFSLLFIILDDLDYLIWVNKGMKLSRHKWVTPDISMLGHDFLSWSVPTQDIWDIERSSRPSEVPRSTKENRVCKPLLSLRFFLDLFRARHDQQYQPMPCPRNPCLVRTTTVPTVPNSAMNLSRPNWVTLDISI